MDLSLLETLNGYAARHDSLFEDPLRFVSVEAPVLFIVLLATLFLANGKLASRNARHGVVAAGFSAALALGIAQIANHLWARPRPYVAHPGDVHLFIPASMDTSFPSDHATAAFAIAVAIFLRSRRAGWIALAMAALVSIGRVVVGTHYPTDVLAGAAIGTLSALVFFHPRVRGPLHALADRAGAIYEGLVLRRPQTEMIGSASAVLACARAVDAGRRTAKGCRAGCPAPFGGGRSGAAERVQAGAGGAESVI